MAGSGLDKTPRSKADIQYKVLGELWLVTMVTRFPNHWWASSCPTTSATHCLEDEQEFFGSISSAVSLENNRQKNKTAERLTLSAIPSNLSTVQRSHLLLLWLFIKKTCRQVAEDGACWCMLITRQLIT